MNPKRFCYVCENADASAAVLAELSATLKAEYADSDSLEITDEDLKRIRDVTGNCPSCILSILRQSGLFAYDRFNYKNELHEWNTPIVEQCGSLMRYSD